MSLNYGLTTKVTNSISTPPTSEKCSRCWGRGWYQIRLGEPGQDTRVQGGYSLKGIKWQEPTRHDCEVCKGTGEKKGRATTIGHYVIEDETHQFTGEHKYGN